MSIEAALQTLLTGDSTLTAMLATWKDTDGTTRPAIFQGMPWPDNDQRWQGAQYPRITYVVNRLPTANQILQGTVHVMTWVQNTTGEAPKLTLIRERVKLLLDDHALYAPDEGMVILQQPTQTRLAATMPGGQRIIGVDEEYRFLGAPAQTTYPPDPIASLNRFVTAYMDTAIKANPGQWAPTDASPALYWRLLRRSTRNEDKGINWWWVNATIRGHVWAPSAYARLNWTHLLVDYLNMPKYRSIRMDDNMGSALRVLSTSEDYDANPYTAGQVTLECQYGIQGDYALLSFSRPPTQPPPSGGTYVPPNPVTGTPGSGTYTNPPQPVFVSGTDTGATIDVIRITDGENNQDQLLVPIGTVITGGQRVPQATIALTTA